MKHKTRATALVLFFLLMLLYTPNAFAALQTPLSTIVSIPPQKYLVEAIGGDLVAVRVMTGQGRDPHSYEPTSAQMADVSKAKIYFAIGVPFETLWLPKFRNLNPALRIHNHLDGIERLANNPEHGLRIASRHKKGAKPSPSHKHSHDHVHHGLETDDPHIWLSPKIMASLAMDIAKTLGDLAPDHAAVMLERAEALRDAIRALDARIAMLFAPLPPEKRHFLTFHQSWTYYAHNYNLYEESVEFQGKEPGPKSMAMLIDFATRKKIKAFVTEPMTSTSAAKALASSISATIIPATPLEENWPDSMWLFSQALAAALAQ